MAIRTRMIELLNKTFTHNVHVTNFVSGLFMGGGLCYAFEKQNYSHIPLIIFGPVTYAGYHLMKNHKEIGIFIFEDKNYKLSQLK